jgi:hypothetical protein
MSFLRPVFRPFGYLAFVVAVAALSVCAWLLGDRDELGFFANRLSGTIWRYPEVTRRGVQMAWFVWAVLFVAALSDTTPWDEVGLGVLAALVLLRRVVSERRANR